MKRFIYIFIAVALLGCSKGEDSTLSQAEQEAENAMLVGTWRENSKTPVTGRRQTYIFTEDFKFTNYSYLDGMPETSLKYNFTDEPYTIPEVGKIAFTRLLNNTRGYEIKDGILYIKNSWLTTPCSKVE